MNSNNIDILVCDDLNLDLLKVDVNNSPRDFFDTISLPCYKLQDYDWKNVMYMKDI